MSYDTWKTTEPDPCANDERPDEPPCKDCGAPPDAPCEPDCLCQHCQQVQVALRRD